jgi:hypothetical protein
LYELRPYDSCVTANGASEGDDVFLLEGTSIVLIRQQETPQSTSAEPMMHYMRGVLANTKSNDSIPKATALLEICLSSLPALAKAYLRTEKIERWLEVAYEEFTLRQIVLVLMHTGQHNDYWNKPL